MTAPEPPTHPMKLAAGCLGLVGAIAAFDLWTGPQLTFGVIYLLPAAACAWWGGFPPGVLLAAAGAVAWSAVDAAEAPGSAPAALIWNGVTRFGTLTLVASLAARAHAGVRRERWLARTDPLTGAANGRHFYEAVAGAADRCRRTGRPLTLAYLDLDDFKQVNDRRGHAAGDEVLSGVAASMRAVVGDAGLLARLGGDEFALLLPGADPEAAALLLARVHRHVTGESAARGWGVGASVGAVTFGRPAADVDRMIQQADALMYGAKRAGKGRVEHAVVGPGDEPAAAGRRATARVLSGCPARVRPTDAAAGGEEYATVRDVTARGVGIHLGRPFPPDTLLVVEPLAPGGRTLLARVADAAPVPGGWAHRCTLPETLDSDDLRTWSGAVGQPGPELVG